jgi:hypothetical protein
LKSETGEIFMKFDIDGYFNHEDSDLVDVKIHFTKDEKYFLKILTYAKYRQEENGRTAYSYSVISYENTKTKKITWQKKLNNIISGFTTDFQRVLALENNPDSTTFYYEFEPKTGNILIKREIGIINWYSDKGDSIRFSYYQKWIA